ncbi:MAG: hypothetical protein ACI9ND_000196 [Yoonia sp.]|jgi:hypothetical protein
MTDKNLKTTDPLPEGQRPAGILWDDSNMATDFANVVNIQGTREQIELFFGTNRTWNVSTDDPVKVQLSNRMILTPYAAKRLSNILNNVLHEYEARHGVLNTDDS